MTYEGLLSEWIDPHCHEGPCSQADQTLGIKKKEQKWKLNCPASVSGCCNDAFLTDFCMNKPCTAVSDSFSGIVRCTLPPHRPGIESG